MSLIDKHEKRSLKNVSTWRSVFACVCLAFTLMIGTGLVLNFLAPWDYSRSGLLYFRQAEAFSFFLFAFGLLMVANHLRPNWQLERVFFRLIISLTAICALSVLVDFSSREFAQIFLICFACFSLYWTMYEKYLREALKCVAVVIVLLLSPVDIIMSSPLLSIDGRQASVKFLEARYGLIRTPEPDTFSMGCIVPPNPLRWVIWIDLWPIVDQVFMAYDEFFHTNSKSGNTS